MSSQKKVQSSSSLDDFELRNNIGAGAYSTVYNVIRNSDGKEYALK